MRPPARSGENLFGCRQKGVRKRTVSLTTYPRQLVDRSPQALIWVQAAVEGVRATIFDNSTSVGRVLRFPEDFLSVWADPELTVSRQVAISVLGAIGLALGALACLSRWDGEAPGVSQWRRGFIARSGPIRRCEGRLAGGFEHALYKPAQSVRLSRAAIAWGRSLREGASRSAHVISDAVLLRLIDGQFDAAVVSLEEAAVRAPEDGAILSDLAAAFIARGTSERRPRDFMLALAAADRAVRAAPDLLEARFNLALALEKALLVGQAQAAWTEYLNHERQVEWSEEARARLKALDHDTQSADWQRSLSRLEILADRHDVAGIRGLAARSPQSARLYAEETLLPRWAEEQFKRKP